MRPGVCTELAPGVRRIVAANAGLMTGPGTNTYLLGIRDLAVLDPGPNDTHHLEAILRVAGAPIRWIIATHTHADHSPLAAELAKRTGASIIGLAAPRDGRQDLSFSADRRPEDGERLELGDIRLTAVLTPGHASNCVCYLLQQERLLFTGDHILEGVSPVILPPDGDMAAYLNSLEKLNAYDFNRIAPGHGGVIEHGKQMLHSLRVHRMARERKILHALRAAESATIEALTPVVYDDVAPERHPWARLTLEAHLIKLAREGQVTLSRGVWQFNTP